MTSAECKTDKVCGDRVAVSKSESVVMWLMPFPLLSRLYVCMTMQCHITRPCVDFFFFINPVFGLLTCLFSIRRAPFKIITIQSFVSQTCLPSSEE